MDNISFEIDAAGIGVATLDMPGRPFNVFSDDMIDELTALIERIENDGDLNGVVVASGKEAFMAGADLAMVRGFTTLRFAAGEDEIRRTFSRLSYTLRRLERLNVPTIAAVNGLALGGGLELAMACHHRVCAKIAAPCLGLPEILLGLLPGAGGTQRLPRLTGPAYAARMLLDGQPVTPAAALEAGLVDHLAEPAQLLDSARAVARNARAGARWDHDGWQAPADDEGVLDGADAIERLAQSGWVDAEVTHLYPAFAAIAHCLVDGRGLPIDDAIEVEVDNFLPLMLDPVAGNMVRTSFLSRTAAPKRAAARLGKPEAPVRRVAVNGGADLPDRFARRVEQVEEAREADCALHFAGGGAEVHPEYTIGVRAVPDEAPTGCAVEIRYAGAIDDAGAVEIAGEGGEMAARALALADRLRLTPVASTACEPGPAARLVTAVRSWAAAHAPDAQARGALAAALDLRALFARAGLDALHGQAHDPALRRAGLALMTTVAAEAAACLAEGLVDAPQDLDVLAVIGLGYPAWSGGPLSFLDGVRRGEIAGAVLPGGLPAQPFYAD